MNDVEGIREDLSSGPEKGPAWLAAEAYGIDMSLVADSLRKPVARRMEEHQAALDTLLMLRKAYLEQYGSASADS
jgi:hypothetical protein